ncbi:uncharacterized protein LOC120167010 [Hibiscus syriacus]|uniref:uncharacterized protein LOC120167010 n=1 Tax=Hibiscus syriacus TaxID=106335 RepID=UPI001922B79E|nr:uncharacterized protein LOC120167010 [Hibiscus syriacus]
MAPYEDLYGRKYRASLNLFELKDRDIIGPDIIKDVEEKVNIIQDNLMIALDRQKSYADLKREGIEYQVAIKYRLDPSHVITSEEIEIQPDLTYKEETMKILVHEVKELRNQMIPLVKVLLRNHKVDKATWEHEGDIRKQFPHMFGAEDN